MLNHDIYPAAGAEAGPPLVIAHGLFGSARNWRAIARKLSATRRVVAVDMRNHADSFHAPGHSYDDMAGDLEAVIGAVCGGTADLLGHSMGGKAAMVLALRNGGMLRKLVIADIAPVSYTHSHAQFIAAMQAVDLSTVTARSDADAQLAARVRDPSMRAFLIQSLAITPEGAHWKLNLDALDAVMEEVIAWPGETGVFDKPVLFLTGARSDYVKPEDHAAIRALFPSAAFESLDGAGHWLHAEKPKEFIAAVDAFLSR
ncbi:alpha/beta fold hydrolase [Paroceanicella profunda]|uniref:alpha/beta fold hydrolase n=1 Tax=Paroceanicella profunda TaxID=2579971 RepID=UPI003D2CAD2D